MTVSLFFERRQLIAERDSAQADLQELLEAVAANKERISFPSAPMVELYAVADRLGRTK